MFCDQCGGRVDPAATVCPACGAQLAQVSIPAQRRPAGEVRGFAIAPAKAWVAWAAPRNLRGTITGIVCAWFNVPFVILMGAFGALIGGVSGVVSGTFVGNGVLARINRLLEWVFPLPVKAEELLPTAALQIGGILGGLLGAVNGAWKLGWWAAVWPWELLFDGDPLWPFTLAIGQVVTALVVGVLWVGWEAATDPVKCRLMGGRRMSRREREWMQPLVDEVAARLGIKHPPVVLMNDHRVWRANTGIRRIMIYRGMLEQLEYQPEPIKAVLAHEMAHWKHGDPVARAWLKGVSWPIYLLYTLSAVLHNASRYRPLQLLFRILLWSVNVTVEKIMQPMCAQNFREMEYRADAAVQAAGYGPGMRTVLTVSRESWEAGRSGWARVFAATHPYNELRLERLEEPGKRYGMEELDSAAVPAPAGFGPTKTSTVRRR